MFTFSIFRNILKCPPNIKESVDEANQLTWLRSRYVLRACSVLYKLVILYECCRMAKIKLFHNVVMSKCVLLCIHFLKTEYAYYTYSCLYILNLCNTWVIKKNLRYLGKNCNLVLTHYNKQSFRMFLAAKI